MKSNKQHLKRTVFSAAFLILMILAAGGILLSRQRTRIDMTQTISFPSVSDLPPSQWQILAQKKIFFAHMSVGYNILDGTERTQKKVPSFLYPIVKTETPAELNRPALYHGQLGHNGDPIAKINSFRDMLLAMKSSPPDITLMKFCYVDFFADTDPGLVFETYQQTIEDLQKEVPEIQFLHCTVPLKSKPVSLKGRFKELVKGLLGKPATVQHNKTRETFNERLRAAYPKESVFDLAFYESITPEGHPVFKNEKNRRIPFLYHRYTTDGGHLNQAGQDHLGEQFLIFLAKNAK